MTDKVTKMSKSDAKRNLIVGIMVSLGWYDIEPFILSWRKNCSPSELLVCVFDEISDWTIDSIKRCATKDLTVTIKKVPDELKGKYFGYIRFKMIEDHLAEHRGEYNQVFVTDMRNVIIQGDPFKGYADYDSYLSYQTGRKMLDEPAVLRWFIPIMGGKIAQQFKKSKLIECGTLMGTADAMETTFRAVNKHLVQDKFDVPAADRAWINYLIGAGKIPVKNIIESDCETGVICTLDVPPIAGDEMLSFDRRIVPAVMRHYDRTPVGQAFADRLYRSNDVPDYKDYDDLNSKLDILNVMLRRKHVVDYLRYTEDFCEFIRPLSEWRSQYWRGVKLLQAFNSDWSESFGGLIAAQFLCQILTKMFGEIPPITDVKLLNAMYSMSTQIKKWQENYNDQFNDVIANGMILSAERAEKRAQIQIWSDLNGKLEELGHSQIERNARSVVAGFNEYLEHIIETKKIDIHEMKDFMEPIFKEAGYRQPVSGDDSCVKNILILCETPAWCSALVLSPAFRELRHLYPNAHITLVTAQGSEDVFKCCPYVNELIVRSFRLDNGKMSRNAPNDLEHIGLKYTLHLKIAQTLLARRYDIAFPVIYQNASTPLLAYMSGAKQIVSHHTGIWRPFVTDFVDQKNISLRHTDKLLSYVEYLGGGAVTDRRLEMWFDHEELNRVKALVPDAKQVYSINLDKHSFAKTAYPAKSYAALINLILKSDGEARFVLLGTSGAVVDSNVIMKNVEPHNAESNSVVNLTGKLTVREMSAAISLCDIHICNINYSMQMAAAADKPLLVPYCFPLEFKRNIVEVQWWVPYGVPSVVVCPSHALSECKKSKDFRGCAIKEQHCITQITPQSMFKALKVLFERVDKDATDYVIYDSEKGVLQ